ncbi:MAG TPA: RecQ family ATP-dependent DNA helicase, partial [Phaeodactylibacter sp.]|nr:RecQ family ATP-dependent DNA helicase [Phaeodactylibacter sp.]
LKNKDLDIVIKAILRTTEGAFQHYVQIRERPLARFLKMDVEKLVETIQRLHQAGILHYIPKKDAPQIVFLQDRVDISNLTIDRQLYNFRKNRQQERVKKMIAYAEEPICRQRQLLAYFGEHRSQDCGHCDICLGRNKVELSPEEFQGYKEKIQKLLHDKSMTVKELCTHFAPRREKKVLRAIDFLTDEGFIEKEKDILHWKDKE